MSIFNFLSAAIQSLPKKLAVIYLSSALSNGIENNTTKVLARPLTFPSSLRSSWQYFPCVTSAFRPAGSRFCRRKARPSSLTAFDYTYSPFNPCPRAGSPLHLPTTRSRSNFTTLQLALRRERVTSGKLYDLGTTAGILLARALHISLAAAVACACALWLWKVDWRR
ncbi:hypothetical protein C8Q78DRAFT_1051318 [Trametes maxima]|nr:hypothetical protein C8Q78DRAFT_1051318 [Trametes maxima]